MPLTTGEFATIKSIKDRLPGPPDPNQVWIGDDAAILTLPGGGWLLLAADTVVGGVHADLTLTSMADLGWKAMAACISDIAAMGGEAGYALVTVAGPPGTDLDGLYDGLAEAAQEYACPIVGGDLANARALVVTVAVTGTCDGPPVRRSGARPGDLLWVTGPLGRSAAGLRLLRSGVMGAGRDGPEAESLIAAHARPRARLAAGGAARRAGATAMIDISDGLAADIGHVADMSGVGFRLTEVPIAQGASRDDAVGGGEDFELVFAVPPGSAVPEAFAGLDQLICIGEVTSDPGERILAGRTLDPLGWEHRW
jgi:thiamine-monophosphate kinase